MKINCFEGLTSWIFVSSAFWNENFIIRTLESKLKVLDSWIIVDYFTIRFVEYIKFQIKWSKLTRNFSYAKLKIYITDKRVADIINWDTTWKFESEGRNF